MSLWLLVIGLGLLLLGVPPSTEEMVRMLGFLVATIAYGGVWLALAMLFSVLFRAPATAALAALGMWLLFSLFWSMLAPLVARLIAGPPEGILGPRSIPPDARRSSTGCRPTRSMPKPRSPCCTRRPARSARC